MNVTRWRKMVGAIGAVVEGVDAREIPVAEIEASFLEHQLLVFRDQVLTPVELAAFAAQFGELDIYPFAEALSESPHVVAVLKEPLDEDNFGGAWHTDTSYIARPPSITLLYAVEVPEIGGDTLFADMYAAYDELSEGMQQALAKLLGHNTAGMVHGSDGIHAGVAGQSVARKETEQVTEANHPIVRVHPRTGRKAIYMSLTHTRQFVGMTRQESLPLLEYLQNVAARAERCTRLKWHPGTLAMWDNRCVQHFPLNDYAGQRRLMNRVIVAGDQPRGVA